MGVPQASEDKVTLPRPVVERRRIRKTIMEKKRRDRINSCLDELSSLLAEERLAEGEAGKADILEQTVRFWHGVRNVGSTSEPGEMETLVAAPDESSYLTGYKQCIRVVDDLLSTCQESGTDTLRQGLLQHLSSCVQELTPPPSASDATGNDVHGPKTATTPAKSGVAEEDKPPLASPQRLTLVPARLPDGALALLLQEGSESKPSLTDEGQQPASSSESGASSTTSSASIVPQKDHERSQQLIKVKTTQELLSPLPSTRAPHQAANSAANPQVSPPNGTTPPGLTDKGENKREVSVHGAGRVTGAEKAPDALGVSVDYNILTVAEMQEEEEEEEEMEEEGETPMDLCIDRVWRPW